MSRVQRIVLASLVFLAASVCLAEAQTCGGPYCNASHTGCQFNQSQSDRPCCCNVSCNGDGCVCTTKSSTSCQFSCPNCSTCTGSLATNVVPFKMPQVAIEQLGRDFPIAEMILQNVSDHYKNPIYTNRVSGGTNIVNAPRGYHYKGVLTSSATELTLDLVFVAIPATDTGADGSATPPQVDQPAPPPTRFQIDQAGAIAVSALAADVSESIRSYEPPKCDQKTKAVASKGDMSVPLLPISAKR